MGYPDPKHSYVLDADVSNESVGPLLSHRQDSEVRVIAYFSNTLTPHEKNYCMSQKELQAVIKTVKHFRLYFYGRHFTLKSDYVFLRLLCRGWKIFHQVAKWLEIPVEFDDTLEHRARVEHGNANGLSRGKFNNCKQCKFIEQRDSAPS